MYSTCIFCHSPLGTNEALAHFPIGRRLAFDATKGRLWAVCGVCRQWNLTPLEERWEAIEEAERLFRDTKLRVATDQIGLARVRDGSELIRIGRPLLPEFASWRYGPRFGGRLRKYAAVGVVGGLAVTGAALSGIGPVLSAALGGVGLMPLQLLNIAYAAYQRHKVIVRLEDVRGPILIAREHLGALRLHSVAWDTRGWRLTIPHRRGQARVGSVLNREPTAFDPRVSLAGDEAVRAAQVLLPILNETGGLPRTVRRAIDVLEQAGSLDESFRFAHAMGRRSGMGDSRLEVQRLPPFMRFALEMAAHEEGERRALEGALADLEERWREAEEVAAIADSMTLPESVLTRLARLARI